MNWFIPGQPGDLAHLAGGVQRDRPYDDIHGAKSAGMRAVLIPNSDVPPFEEAIPDAVITRLSELPPLLDVW